MYASFRPQCAVYYIAACAVSFYVCISAALSCEINFKILPQNSKSPRSTQSGHLSEGKRNEHQRKLGGKQAQQAMHKLVSQYKLLSD